MVTGNFIEPPKDKLYDEDILKNELNWGINNAHDPGIFKDGDWYYTFSTDANVGGNPRPGIQIRKSKDLINWSFAGTVFDDVPAEAKAWTGASGLWAPDMIKMKEYYYVYYCASQFGKTRSFIGVARSKAIGGPWEDLGEVFKTDYDDENNAIDPNIVRDENGNLYMCYGSFFGGIYISKLDPLTGKLMNYGRGTLIARRNTSVDRAIEGPYIVYNNETKKYFLFVSFDSLFNDYNVRVGCSDNIEGPFKDYNGNLLTDINEDQKEIGTKILGGYRFKNSEGWIAPGHNSVLRDGEDFYIVHHARAQRDKRWHYLHVRKLLWTDEGWPVVSPERYAGEKEEPIDRGMLYGEWEAIVLDKQDNLQLTANTFKLLEDGSINSKSSNSFWEFDGFNTIKLYHFAPGSGVKGDYWIDTVKVLPSWDWENWKSTLVYTGMNQSGICVWGKKRN